MASNPILICVCLVTGLSLARLGIAWFNYRKALSELKREQQINQLLKL